MVLGFIRDSVFKSINALLRAWDLDQDYFLPKYFSFLENYEYADLVNIKWLLTLFFSILYLFLSIFTLKLLFNDKRHIKVAIYTYTGIIGLSSIFILIGLIWPSQSEKMYEFARFLMGMAQSTIILMLLIPALKLSSEKEKPKTSNE